MTRRSQVRILPPASPHFSSGGGRVRLRRRGDLAFKPRRAIGVLASLPMRRNEQFGSRFISSGRSDRR